MMSRKKRGIFKGREAGGIVLGIAIAVAIAIIVTPLVVRTFTQDEAISHVADMTGVVSTANTNSTTDTEATVKGEDPDENSEVCHIDDGAAYGAGCGGCTDKCDL